MSFQTPHIWCFFVLRCLIYKVHAPTAERILGYHNFPALSTLFLCFCNFSSLAMEEGKPLSESCPLFANRSYLSTPPELLQVLILYFSFFGQTAQSEPLMSVITAKNSRREVGKAPPPSEYLTALAVAADAEHLAQQRKQSSTIHSA